MSKFCLSYWVIAKELMPSNCGAGEDFWEPLRQQGDQPWIFTRITDTEAEAPVFWSSDMNRWLIGKVPDVGKDWGQKEKRASEVEMVGQHHWFNEHDLGKLWEMGRDVKAWWAAVHGVAKSRTWLGNRTMMCVCRVGRRAGLKLHLDKRQFYSIFQKNVTSVLTTKWLLLPSPCLVFFIFTELSLIYFGFIDHTRNLSSITLRFPSFYLSWQLPSRWY